MTSQGTVHAARPAVVAEGGAADVRVSPYGEPFVQPLTGTTHPLATEGSYFTACNPTPGTAIEFAVSASVSETAGYFLVMRNNWSIGDPSARLQYPDYLRLILNTAPASATAGHFFLKTDVASKYTSGGSSLSPVNVNAYSGNTSGAQVYAGALTTATASSAARLMARGVLRSVIPVVNDEWIFNFGPIEFAGAISDIAGTTAKRIVVPVPPVILGPQQALGLQLWFPSNAATPAQFEVEAGWWER